MNINSHFLLFIGFFILFIPLVNATITIDINVSDSFSLGEKISFDYSIISDVDESISYYATVGCEDAPMALLEVKNAILNSNVPLRETYNYLLVEDYMEPQKCAASVTINEPEQIIKNEEFEIITNPRFEFDLRLCKDELCTEELKVFIKGEDIYFDYSGSVENPSITATLTYPDKTTEQITLPTTIKAEHIGTYELEVTTSKEGYKTMTKKEQFGVIEKQAEIKDASICNANGICDNNENYKNCPQDCPPIDKKIKQTRILFWIIALVIILLVAIFAVVRIHKKRIYGF